MSNLNKCYILGNLTRDPELKYTPQGTAIANFALAVNRQFKGSDGEVKKEVTFFNIVVWNKAGENCAKFLKKGSSALVEGRIVIRSYEKDGVKKWVTEIIGENVQFLSSPGERSEKPQGEQSPGVQDDGAGYAEGDGSTVPF